MQFVRFQQSIIRLHLIFCNKKHRRNRRKVPSILDFDRNYGNTNQWYVHLHLVNFRCHRSNNWLIDFMLIKVQYMTGQWHIFLAYSDNKQGNNYRYYQNKGSYGEQWATFFVFHDKKAECCEGIENLALCYSSKRPTLYLNGSQAMRLS